MNTEEGFGLDGLPEEGQFLLSVQWTDEDKSQGGDGARQGEAEAGLPLPTVDIDF